jgi:hypothetical protein
LKCRRRLEPLNFDDKTVIFQAVEWAHRGLHSLHFALIYLCRAGMVLASRAGSSQRSSLVLEVPQQVGERRLE